MSFSKAIFATSVLLLATVGAHAAPTKPDRAEFANRTKAADANHDKSVTRTEFLAFRAAKFTQLDRNNDNFLTLEDLPNYARNAGPGTQFKQLMQNLDLNHDGQVSHAEFVQGPTLMFDALDLNHNGTISADEFEKAKY